MKKVFYVLMILSLVLFFSCGSTKQNSDTNENLEPQVQDQELVETEESAQEGRESEESSETEFSEEESSQSGAGQSSTEDAESYEDINILYPPLEEIEEPDLIELSPQEIEEELAVKKAEENENQITEPVEETEELPPLPAAEDAGVSVVPEPVEGVENTEDQESNEELSVEPVIEIQEEAEEIIITPSRSVSLKKGETLVVTYPGTGWIYMGSTSEYNNLASRGRKLGTTDTKYTLLAKEAGTQIHHFYKVDNLTGEYIDDYIEVTVLDKKGKSSTVVNAPDYSQLVPKKPESPAKSTQSQAQTQTQVQTQTKTEETKAVESKPAETKAKTETKAESKNQQKETVVEDAQEDSVIVIDEEEAEEEIDLSQLLNNADSAVNAKKYDDAYPLLVQYLEFSTDNRDLALYLLGQILESDSKYKDIKQAVETYQTLCDSYPASKYWEAANKRIVYLKRFYINIH